MADIDNDGDMDLIVGDYDGFITTYIRTDEGDLESIGYLQVEGEDFNSVGRAAPRAIDWELDGDIDLIVGSMVGTLTLLINVGSPEEDEYEYAGTIEEDGREIWLGSETVAAVGDLDEDGMRDLVVGSVFGELWFFPNVNEDDDPIFGPGERISDEDNDIWLVSYTRPDLADWDGDGDFDLICGMLDPMVNLYINPGVDEVAMEPVAPGRFVMLTNYPEPFNSTTSLRFRLEKPEIVSAYLCSSNGRMVKIIFMDHLSAGAHEVSLDVNELSAGRYFIRFSTDRYSSLHPITLIK